MSLSIVIPTFQRRQIVRASIGTALAFARATSDSEVIVVDDASSDGTVEMIRAAYTREIESGLLVVVQRVTNGGAMAAKNAGARSARGDWLIFLDSDDQLLPIASQAITAFAARYKTTPVLFFRCQDEAGYLVGPAASAGPLDLDTLLRRGTPGECLPVVSRAAFLAHPYDEDLRVFEILTYLRMVQPWPGYALGNGGTALRHHGGGPNVDARPAAAARRSACARIRTPARRVRQ